MRSKRNTKKVLDTSQFGILEEGKHRALKTVVNEESLSKPKKKRFFKRTKETKEPKVKVSFENLGLNDEEYNSSKDKTLSLIYIHFSKKKIHHTEEVADGIMIDYDKNHCPVGVEIIQGRLGGLEQIQL